MNGNYPTIPLDLAKPIHAMAAPTSVNGTPTNVSSCIPKMLNKSAKPIIIIGMPDAIKIFDVLSTAPHQLGTRAIF